ncbi:NADH-quinone oxidoreductase subunit M [Buchnera aphidicola (Pterocallis alni)]|uniref:complex I subunit 4 family protein n=1 Tax=Buchnera aphidicola TaxID=9 RepID=UPI00346456C0
MLLLLFILLPLLSIMLCLTCEYVNIKISKWIALITMSLVFFLSIFLWGKYFYFHNIVCNKNSWIEEFQIPWIPILGIEFHLGIDGLSLIMLVLSSFIAVISVLCSWDESKNYSGFFYSSTLLIFIGTVGVILSLDLFLFFCFWEIMLLPIYFLVIFWGNKIYNKKDKIYTANKFLIYTQLSSLLMLFSIFLLSWNCYVHTHILTFNYNILSTIPIYLPLEYTIMIGFFLAFAVKMPIIPFHSWLPNLHSRLLPSASIDLLGLSLKVSIYGLLRFNTLFFKVSSMYFFYNAFFLGLCTIFYASWMAFNEKNIKKIIAYSSIAHMGFMLIGIYCGDTLSLQGVVLQMIFNTISTSGLLVLFGQIYSRFKIMNIMHMGGIYTGIKWIPSFVFFFFFTNLNFPGTPNFIGEVMILLGVLHKSLILFLLLMCSLFFPVIYSLNVIHRVFYGPLLNYGLKKIIQTNYLEFSLIFVLMIITILSGLFPEYILHTYNILLNNIY